MVGITKEHGPEVLMVSIYDEKNDNYQAVVIHMDKLVTNKDGTHLTLDGAFILTEQLTKSLRRLSKGE